MPLLVLLGACPAIAQDAPDGTLTIDRLFGGEFRAAGFGPSRWLEDSGLATLEDADGGGQYLVRFDPASGQRTVLVAAKQLVPESREQPLRIAGYQFSPDGSKVLIFTNTRRVWRRNTRGYYWVLDRASGDLAQLGADFEPGHRSNSVRLGPPEPRQLAIAPQPQQPTNPTAVWARQDLHPRPGCGSAGPGGMSIAALRASWRASRPSAPQRHRAKNEAMTNPRGMSPQRRPVAGRSQPHRTAAEVG